MINIFSALLAGPGRTPTDAARRRNLLALSLATFLASVGFMIVLPLLPTLIRESLAGDVDQLGPWLGLAISISPLLTALTGPFWTVLGVRFGHKAMIQRALLCIGIGIGLLAVASSPLQVVALRGFIGALGGISVAALAAVAATTPRRELGPAVGMLQAAQMSGAVVGPLVGGLLGGLLGMREAFMISGAIFVGAIVLVQQLYCETPALVVEGPTREAGSGVARDGSAVDTRAARGRAFGGGVGGGILVILGAAFVGQFVEGSLLVLLPLRLESLGAAPESVPWLFGLGLSAASLAAALTGALGGRLASSRSAKTLLCGVLILGLVGLVPLALATVWWQFLVLRVLLGFAVGALPTLAYSAAAEAAPPHRRAAMVGLVSSAGIFGFAASPLLAGTLARVDPTLLLALDGLLYAVILAALWAGGRGLLRRVTGWRLTVPARRTLLPNVGRLEWARSERDTAPRFTPAEVSAALRGDASGARADAILDVAAQPSAWLPANPARAFRDAPRYADRLPTILHLLRQGEDAESIGRRLSLFGGAWPIERTVDTAARLIAAHLNRR